MLLSDSKILKTCDSNLCLDRRLQLAHDRMLLCRSCETSDEYAAAWDEYKAAGGNLTMHDAGIDNGNWKRHTTNGGAP